MTDDSRHHRRRRRIVALAVLGLLAGTAWLLPARLGPPSPAMHATASQQATGDRRQQERARPGSAAHQDRTGAGRSAGATARSSPPDREERHERPGKAGSRSGLPSGSAKRDASGRPCRLSPVACRLHGGPGVPVRLRIPALGLLTAIEPVGLHAGAMDVPTNVWHVGWFRLGPRPGAVGNAVIDGHLDSTTGPAIFLTLHNLRVGDRIYVTDRAGIERGFVVTELHSYSLSDAPLARIFGPTTGRHLNLITCSGTWQAQAHQYNERLVVYTRLLVG